MRCVQRLSHTTSLRTSPRPSLLAPARLTFRSIHKLPAFTPTLARAPPMTCQRRLHRLRIRETAVAARAHSPPLHTHKLPCRQETVPCAACGIGAPTQAPLYEAQSAHLLRANTMRPITRCGRVRIPRCVQHYLRCSGISTSGDGASAGGSEAWNISMSVGSKMFCSLSHVSWSSPKPSHRTR